MGDGCLSWEILANRLGHTVVIVLLEGGRDGWMADGCLSWEILANRLAPTMVDVGTVVIMVFCRTRAVIMLRLLI
jgi:hypothetical protein